MVAKRPALTEDSFLAHLFSPKKNALPTGLRARPIASSKGRRVARVNAYNKMPAVKQEALKRSGLRDAFLKGEVTYTDARKALRGKAEERGIVKALRARGAKAKTSALSAAIKKRRKEEAYTFSQHLMSQLRRANKQHDPSTVVAGSFYIQEDDVETLDYEGIKERAKDKNFEMEIGGHSVNPYWYR